MRRNNPRAAGVIVSDPLARHVLDLYARLVALELEIGKLFQAGTPGSDSYLFEAAWKHTNETCLLLEKAGKEMRSAAGLAIIAAMKLKHDPLNPDRIPKR